MKTETQPKKWEPGKRYQTSVQLSKVARDRMCDQAARLGCSRAAVVEMAIRALARKWLGRI